MSRNYSVARVARVVMASLPQRGNRDENTQRLTVVVGCCTEIPILEPSSVEIGLAINGSHTNVQRHQKLWFALPWRERCSWLTFTEGRLADETITVDAVVL